MPNSLNQKLNAIDKLILNGKFSNALDDIEKLKKTVKKNSQEFYQLLIWEKYLVIKLGDYSKAIENLDKIINSLKKKDFQLLFLKAILVKISILSEIGKYDEILSTINFVESLLENIDDLTQKKNLKAQITFLKGQYYFDKGESTTTKTIFEESIVICNELLCTHVKAQVFLYMSIIAMREGDKEASFNYVNKSLQITEENEFLLVRGRAYSNLAILYNMEGKLDETLTYLQKGLELLKQVGAINDLARLNINLGVVHHFSGNLNTSLSYYQEALENFQKVGNNLTIATTIFNIGLIYNLQGKLRDALASYEYIIPLFQELSNVSLITAAYNSIGKVYFDLGLIEEAENYLSLVYQLKDKITPVSLSKTLFYLVQVLISRNKITVANDLVNELENISQEQDNNVIKHRFQFLKGLVLSVDEKVGLGEVEEIFLQVINEPVTDQETTINAIINYCYLLIKKYSQNRNEDVLERLEYYSDRLSKLETKQQSKLLFAEYYWIKSIIASLENKDDEAKEISKQAIKMAKEMEFMRLLNKIMEFNLQN
ncbi:MAG: tetratricopeptide repeat protein [Candidatus Heimdallarchaeota archaeon]|nr:tetratricopeptide repeat protein [Candidatus Heimdallarchaeota archaeon]